MVWKALCTERPLLAFLTESGLLKTLKVRAATIIIAFENDENQTEIWHPEDRNQIHAGCKGRRKKANKEVGDQLRRA